MRAVKIDHASVVIPKYVPRRIHKNTNKMLSYSLYFILAQWKIFCRGLKEKYFVED